MNKIRAIEWKANNADNSNELALRLYYSHWYNMTLDKKSQVLLLVCDCYLTVNS